MTLADAVEHNYGISGLYSKLAIFIIISILLTVIIEPERVDGLALLSVILLGGLGFLYTFKNLHTIYMGKGIPFDQVPKVDTEYTGQFTGNVAYAFELSAVYLSRTFR